jgi:hypothetical protein
MKVICGPPYWYCMYDDIINYVQLCHPCQVAKGSKSYKRGQLSPLHATYHGQIVHFDHAGPFYGNYIY